MIMQDGLTALDIPSLEGYPEVYQELVTARSHGKQWDCLSAYVIFCCPRFS